MKLVLGLGDTGLSIANFLATNSLDFKIADSRSTPPNLVLYNSQIKHPAPILGEWSKDLLVDVDEVIISPGIAQTEDIVIWAREKNIDVISDIELFSRYAKAPVIGITGSNGKSTVTQLLGEMLSNCNKNVAIGGNIGTASPNGDTLPCLIALDATLTLFSKGGNREMPLEDFFIAYRKTDLKPGEFIKSIRIPKLKDAQKFRAYKISKRYDQDISSVTSACRFEIDGLRVKDIRIAFGGMAEIPKRAVACEGKFLDKEWVEDTALKAGLAVATDFKPLSDHRATKNYRLCVAANLFIRLYRDLTDLEDLMEVVAA